MPFPKCTQHRQTKYVPCPLLLSLLWLLLWVHQAADTIVVLSVQTSQNLSKTHLAETNQVCSLSALLCQCTACFLISTCSHCTNKCTGKICVWLPMRCMLSERQVCRRGTKLHVRSMHKVALAGSPLPFTALSEPTAPFL